MGVAKVDYFGQTLIDLTNDTITPETVLKGFTAHDANGDAIVGTFIGGGSGESTDLVKYVTFIGADGTELYKMPVLNGDDCKDPITHEDISTPTKEPTVAIVYTYSGWSLTSGGSADSTALANVTEDRTVYAAFTESARMYTVNFYDGDILLKTEQVAYGGSSNFIPSKVDNVFTEWQPSPTNITGDMDCYAQWIEDTNLANMSWANISKLSATGTAENYWALGDKKQIRIDGQVGAYTLIRVLTVEIIGFDHNSIYEGKGVHFGNFRATGSYDNAVAFGTNTTTGEDGSKKFNMNHWGGYNYGGWAGCDMRYDILGSTDVPPSGYGSAVTAGRVGYNPTETCATNPVPHTFMAALPEDLRAVMKPMTKYTDNVGGGTNAEENVTATIDYLPLLSEFEMNLEGTKYANTNEQQYQKPYAQYVKRLYPYTYTGSANSSAQINHWKRSPSIQNASEFCTISASGKNYYMNAKYSIYISPIFKV